MNWNEESRRVCREGGGGGGRRRERGCNIEENIVRLCGVPHDDRVRMTGEIESQWVR